VSGGRIRAGRVWTKSICLNLAKDYAAAMAEAAPALVGTAYELDADRVRRLCGDVWPSERYLRLLGRSLAFEFPLDGSLPACSSRSTINGLGWLGARFGLERPIPCWPEICGLSDIRHLCRGLRLACCGIDRHTAPPCLTTPEL
jgi:hypothetical protein